MHTIMNKDNSLKGGVINVPALLFLQSSVTSTSLGALTPFFNDLNDMKSKHFRVAMS